MSLYSAPSELPESPTVDAHLRHGLAGVVQAWVFVPLALVALALVAVSIFIVMRVRAIEVAYVPATQDIARPINRQMAPDVAVLAFAQLYACRSEAWSYRTLERLSDEVAPFVATEERSGQRSYFAKLAEDARTYRQSQSVIVLGAQVRDRTATSAVVDVALRRMHVSEDRNGGLTPNRMDVLIVSYRLVTNVVTDENAYGLLVTQRSETDGEAFLKSKTAFWTVEP